ncbi:MAG: hypothetical protein ACE5IA_06375 [Dehalococcoidia bacterium]
MPTINFRGQPREALEVKFKAVREDWNEYDLEDGTTVRMKTVVSEVVRVPEEFDNEDNPVYVVKSANLLVVKAPDSLKKAKT